MNDETMQENVQDNKNPWNADLNDPMLGLRLASERLSIVRYVFLVQVEEALLPLRSARRLNTRMRY